MRQKFADEPLSVHEGCGGAVERLISAPALQFKGTGWYVTDYARNGNSSTTSNGKSESKDGKKETKWEPPAKEVKAPPHVTAPSPDK